MFGPLQKHRQFGSIELRLRNDSSSHDCVGPQRQREQVAASPGNAVNAVQLDHGSASCLIVRPMAEGLGRFLWST